MTRLGIIYSWRYADFCPGRIEEMVEGIVILECDD